MNNQKEHLQQGSQSWDKQTNNQYEKKHQKNQQSIKKSSKIYDVNWFPINTSPWISAIAFIYFILFFVHIINFYFTVYLKIYQNPGLFSFTTMITPSIVSLGYAINIILNILCLISFFYNDIDQEGFKYLIAWLGNKVYPVIRYLIELNLALAGFMFLVDDVSAGFFILTALINLFITFFAQNYVLRKDYLCCKNVTFLIFYKIIIIIGYAINCIGYKVIGSQQKKTFLIVLIIHMALSLLTFITYFVLGFNIYRHTTPRVLLIGSITLYVSMSLSILYDQANRQYKQNSQTSYIVYQIIFFGFISFFSFVSLQNMRRNSIGKDQKNFKKKIYYIFNIMEGSSQSMDDDCQIRGIIRYHIKNICYNKNCFINRNKIIYDSKKNKQLFLDKINQGKSSLTKFYLKCLYQQKLQQQNWKNTDTVLEYLQFFYMKLKNTFKVIQLITEIQAKYLTPFQKLKLQRIKKTMKQQNGKLNNQLYLSQLDIENIIHAQLKFQQVKDQICDFLKRNLVFWKYVQKDSIDLSEMSSIVQPNFKLVQNINNNWKQLAKYFQIQKRWKFYFVCYTLYVKNQKIKPQFLQYFGTNVHQEQLFDQQSYHIDKTTQQQKLFNSKMLFESNSCFIHISSQNEKSIIKKVSKYFTKIFKYQAAQILQSTIETLMPQSIKKIHHQKFLQWAGQGKSNNQSTYEIKKIFPISKNGYIVPVYKFYKQVLYLDSKIGEYNLQYIAMIKKNKQDQLVAILNQDFQIEAFSQTLIRKFKLHDDDYQFIKKLNILAFCPSLLKYTKLQVHILKGDDDFKRDQSKKSMSQNTSTAAQKQKKYSKILEVKKQITQTNCRILMGIDLRTSQQLYKKGKQRIKQQSDQRYYHGIRQVFYYLKKSRQYKKFKSQVQIKQRSALMQNSKKKLIYYEVYFRDMQQSGLNDRQMQKKQKQQQQNINIQGINAMINPKQDQVLIQDFHLYFQSNSNSQSISLAFTNNIFIKQDNNKPVQMISHVSSITITVRIFFIMFMIIVFSVFFLETSNSNNILERGIKLNLITEFQLKMILAKNSLYGIINGIQDKIWVEQEIVNKTSQLISKKENYYLKKIILDETINKYNLYGPNKFISQFQTPSYDQIDLIDLIIQKISTFRYMDLSTLTLNNTEFITFQNYLLPSFNQMTNRTKIQLNTGFTQLFYQTQLMTIILFIVQTLLLIVGFFVVFTRLIKISNSFIALMEIFTQLSEGDVKKTWRYSEYVIKLFIHLNQKDQQMSQKQAGFKYVKSLQNNSSLRADEHLEEQIQNANLNKKVKKVEVGQQLNKIKIKSTILIIIFLIFYGLSSYAFNIFMSSSITSIQQFKNKGYDQLFKFIPNMQIAVHGMNKKYSQMDNFTNDHYQIIYQNLAGMKEINTVFESQTQFQKKYRILFFDDFCLLYDKIFQSDQIYSKCRDIAQNTLQHGVQSYLYFLYSDVTNFLIPQYLSVGLKSLKDNHFAVKIIDYYILDLMTIWLKQFTLKIVYYQQLILFISIGLIFFHIIIYIILVEIFIVGNLKEKYQIFKKIYLNYMPDFVVSKEKIIKAKLHVQGFLQN